MKNKFKVLFLFLLFFSTNLVMSKIFISGDSLAEIQESFAQLQPVLPVDGGSKDVQGRKLGVLDRQIKKVEDRFASAWATLDANKKFLKLSSALGLFVYSRYINTQFLPNLIKTGATTAMGYLSIFIDALFHGALVGAWENKGMTGKIVGGLILYAVVNNVMGIGMKVLSESWVAGSKKKAENEMDKRYGKI